MHFPWETVESVFPGVLCAFVCVSAGSCCCARFCHICHIYSVAGGAGGPTGVQRHSSLFLSLSPHNYVLTATILMAVAKIMCWAGRTVKIRGLTGLGNDLKNKPERETNLNTGFLMILFDLRTHQQLIFAHPICHVIKKDAKKIKELILMLKSFYVAKNDCVSPR